MMIRLLIVDDSAFMRKALSQMVASDPEITVVGTARDGLEAIEKVISLRPDIVTMDVEMPRMGGLEALKVIMEKNPVPVLMVSSLTEEGAKVTLDALDLGAVDFIPKNLTDLSFNILKIKEILADKIKQIGKRGVRGQGSGVRNSKLKTQNSKLKTKFTHPSPLTPIKIVAIGTSTGGPKALQEIIPKLPGNFPVGILIAQHMPAAFTGPFAERLSQLSRIEVKEAEEGEPIRPGVALIAPGRGHMLVSLRKLSEPYIEIFAHGESIYRPSVDILMLSVAEHFPGRCLGVILTGMGNDGKEGMKAIKFSGGTTIAQDEDTSIVYGMPKAVVQASLADKVLPLEEIAEEIINIVKS